MLGVREGDRRIAWAGFGTLFVAMTAHSVLETARDTLFLTGLPADRLPWAYLAMAAVTFVVAASSHRFDRARGHGKVLVRTLGAASVGTAVLAWLTTVEGPSALVALYVWTGLVATLVVIAFWLCLGERVDLTQAKRIYGLIAAGALGGAIAGSVAADVALRAISPPALVPIAAGLYAVAAVVAARTLGAGTIRERRDPEPGGRGHVTTLLREPYTRRIAAAALLAPIVATGIDFVFKSIVSQRVATADLGPFFARYNAATYTAALLFQLALASRLLGWLGVTRSLTVLPLLLCGGAVALTGAVSLAVVMALRAMDVALRHSLHRAATEILYLPIAAAPRTALKAFTDSVGQRGGQALASIALLVGIHLGATVTHIAGGLAVLALVWALTYGGLRRHYVERFRSQLRELSPESEATVPELDLHALEALMSTLSAANDAEVLAALDILEAYGRARLVPPLILYHPSRDVILRALRLFANVERDDVDAIRRRLLDHSDPEVRAAAVRALAATGCPSALLRTVANDDPDPAVQTTALVAWLGRRSETDEVETERQVREILATWRTEARLALALAVGEFGVGFGARLAAQLVHGGPAVVRQAVSASLADTDDVAYLDVCVELLAFHETRASARAALVAMGEPALERLARLLVAADAPPAIRLHVPRSISRFPGPHPATILAQALATVETPRIRYKILRGLGRMRVADPSLPVDPDLVLAAARRSFGRAVQALQMLVAWDAHRVLSDSAGDDLLRPLLAEAEERSLEEVFRALHVLAPQEQFRTMYTGLRARDGDSAASSRELLEHVVADPGLRDGILAMTDSVDTRERLALVRRVWPVADDLDVPTDVPPADDAAHTALAERVRAALDRLRGDDDTVVAALASWSLGASAAPEETP
jgi:AAA family ATP:ADP antiporter